MTVSSLIQIILYLAIILLLVKPLGWYMACVYEGKPCGLNSILASLERFIYRVCGIKAEQEMDWKKYTLSMLLLNFFGFSAVFLIQLIQGILPLNPQGFPAVSIDLAFNTAASFVTNTNWQAYGGENSLSYFTQMSALTVQNFLSAATGISILIALIRGISRRETANLGNFWVDTLRGTLYIFLPLSFIFSIVLVSQGVIQNFEPYQKAHILQKTNYQEQVIPMGPTASQVAIKQLGTNGGGFFNTNSAHPFENPTPLSSFLEMLAILAIPAALCYTFGYMVRDKRQGWAIFAAMFLILIPLIFATATIEQGGNPILTQMGVDPSPHSGYPGGNMEGKETRFGIPNSALWATATTAASNGSVNSMHDSFIPMGGMIPLWLMQTSEIVFGGVGSGLYGMLIFVIVAVFVAGLMIGRTPEYLGKKIEPFEMKMASFIVLLIPLMALISTATAVLTDAARKAVGNPGIHGFTEMLYAFSSMANNNGSAFAGLNANIPFYNILGGIVMLIGRYGTAIAILAVAGSLARKKIVPTSLGTLPTHTPLFVGLLISVVLIVAALTFFPAQALGPIIEQLVMRSH